MCQLLEETEDKLLNASPLKTIALVNVLAV
jgi:hypothetical protein